jgi:alkylation response protein AidB-like acyl-CoA dehydrogenase
VTVRLDAVGELPPELDELRLRVRRFLREEIASGAITTEVDAWGSGIDVAFSRRLAERGWVGMTIPARYGGHGRSAFERFVVTEELLVAGAPVGAHWIADRQMAPSILRNGSEAHKQRYLPAIARGEAFFSIGMSEPDSGSDLASVRTRARLTGEGWRLSGTKLWTSVAHIATAMIVLARTDDGGDDRHAGLSQFIVDLPNPGIRISPVITIDGAHHFNEVVFDDALIPESALLGRRGDGWRQVTAELGNERSGPERILSTFPVLAAWARSLPQDPVAQADLGRLTARLVTLRQLSLAVAAELDRGGNPATEAALVKDLGTQFEGDVVHTVSRHAGAAWPEPAPGRLAELVTQATLHVPAFTLRGGTTEVLRGIVAKGLMPEGQPAKRQPGTSGHRGELADAVSAVLGKDPHDWAALAELGFTSLTVPEELGGSGGDLRDAAVVVAEAARHGSTLPLAEALFLSGPLLAAGLAAGLATGLAAGGSGPLGGGWDRRAELLGATARAVQIGGAARAVLDLTVTHARQRVQFGRALSKFQAVQQLLARLAADVTTITVAADAAVRALAGGELTAELLVAAAKAEASSLAVQVAAIGHQVHGAIGYTAEHRLGDHTRQLWSWRQENGNELYWHRRIAGLIEEASGDLWPLVTNTKGLTA